MIPKGSCFPSWVSYVEDPDYFYVKIHDQDSSVFSQLMPNLHTNLSYASNPKIGNIFLRSFQSTVLLNE